jgi:hypothetical protein
MALPSFKPGALYASRSQVRAAYREFWKGILVRDERVAIIVAYEGLARRVHYRDRLVPRPMRLEYVGEGLQGSQSLTRGNVALRSALGSEDPVDVFFDCGDIQLPVGEEQKFEKHFVAGGQWRVVRARYAAAISEARRVWRFTLVPTDVATELMMEAIFGGVPVASFEDLLKRFARVRRQLYDRFPHILPARDSIAGHVGEYFAVQRFNRKFPDVPLVRVRSNFRDLDAVQTRTGRRFAVKIVTDIPSKTSNIWCPFPHIRERLDDFLIVHLDRDELRPRNMYRLPASRAEPFWFEDTYQRSGKLNIDERFLRVATAI